MFDSIIEPAISWVMQLISDAGYWGIGISMAIESFFVPFPSEVIMPFSGFLVATGRFTLIGISIVGGVGSYLGTLPFYFLGYIGGDSLVRKFLQRWGKWIMVSEKELDQSNNLFQEKGKILVLVGRLIPGIRSVLSIPAGLAKMNFVAYSIYTLVGSIFWSFVLGFLGFVLGENWESVGGYFKKFESFVIIIVVVISVAYIINKLRKR